MKRREFLEGVGFAAAGSLMIPESLNAGSKQRIEFAKGPADRPMDIQITVQPVFSPIVHTDVWEGPCWFSPDRLAKLEADRDKVDAYLYTGTLLTYPATLIAEIYKNRWCWVEVLVPETRWPT